MGDNKKSIGEEIKLYTTHLESLRSTLPFTMQFLQEAAKHYGTEYDKFVDQNCEIEPRDGNNKLITVKPEHYRDYKKKLFHNRNFAMARSLVPRSFVVSMVSQYDAYLGRLLRIIYLSKPEIFKNSSREFTFADVSAFDSIEDFKEHAIEKEVESFLRDSHAQQFKTLENKFGISLTKGLDIWPAFIELIERRNLFVHSDGIVSRQYMSVCEEHGVDLSNVKEGDILGVPQEYFISVYNCLYEIGVKLGHVLWRKILPKEVEAADESFIITTYDLIERGEYDLACNILDSALKMWDKKFFDEGNKLCLVINCAQAHKWAKREDHCKKIMQQHDWSSKELKFKLANAVLQDDWEKSVQIMRKIGVSEDFKDICYRDWPLFKQLRKQKLFLDAYKEIYGKEFEIIISSKSFESSNTGDERNSASEPNLEAQFISEGST